MEVAFSKGPNQSGFRIFPNILYLPPLYIFRETNGSGCIGHSDSAGFSLHFWYRYKTKAGHRLWHGRLKKEKSHHKDKVNYLHTHRIHV
jgi:hypothetical protein